MCHIFETLNTTHFGVMECFTRDQNGPNYYYLIRWKTPKIHMYSWHY